LIAIPFDVNDPQLANRGQCRYNPQFHQSPRVHRTDTKDTQSRRFEGALEWEFFSRGQSVMFIRSTLTSAILLLALLISGCSHCGRAGMSSREGFLKPRSVSDVTPEGYPRQRGGYPQYVGEHDPTPRAAVMGNPQYHNEYPAPDFPV